MTNRKPVRQALNITLVGKFNPAIFQPGWFYAEDLIRKQEAEDAEIVIIHNDIVEFNLDWLLLRATRERVVFETTNEAYYEPLRDLAIGTFNLLRHTPINMMGINITANFRMDSEKEWHALGHKLAPKDIWIGILKDPGMLVLSMQGNIEENGPIYSHNQIRIESRNNKEIPYGVFFEVNNHFEVNDTESVLGCNKMIDILSDQSQWDHRLKEANRIIQGLLKG